MTFNFDIVLLLIAVFMLLSGFYFGFYNELRRVLSNVGGLMVAILVTDTVLGFLGGIANTIAKVIKFVFVNLNDEMAAKLTIGFVIFLIAKLFIFMFVGIFKQRGTKAFLKDKSTLSTLTGGILGLVNALAVGFIFFILFEASLGAIPGSIAPKVFGILKFIPQIENIINGVIAVA